jgi:hypothetical protein
VAAIVGISALSLLRRLAPRGMWQAQARLSFYFERPGRPAWLRRVGLWLRPSLAASGGACGSACSRCRACD